MTTQDYKKMLEAVEQALEVCRGSSGLMDEMHSNICEELHDARTRLLSLIGAPSPQG